MGEELDLNKLRDEVLAGNERAEAPPVAQGQDTLPTDEQPADAAASETADPEDPNIDRLREIAEQRRSQRVAEGSDVPPAA